MLNTKLKIILIATAISSSIMLSTSCKVLASDIANINSNIKIESLSPEKQSIADSIVNMVSENTEFYFSKTALSNNGDVLAKDSNFNNITNQIKSYISSAKSTRTSLINDFGIPSTHPTIYKIDALINKLYLTISLHTKALSQTIINNSYSDKIASTISSAKLLKSYLLESENLSNNNTIIQTIDVAISDLENNTISIYEKEIINKIDAAIKSQKYDELSKAITFGKDTKNEIQRKYSLNSTNETISRINTAIDSAEKKIPEIKVTEAINNINLSINSEDLSSLESANELANNIRAELIENFNIMPTDFQIIRIDSSLKRLSTKILEATKNKPIHLAIEELESIIGKNEFVHPVIEKTSKSYTELTNASNKLINLRDNLVKNDPSNTTSINKLNSAIETSFSPLINALNNEYIALRNTSIKNTNISNIYKLGGKFNDLKNFLTANNDLSSKGYYVQNLDNLINTFYKNFNINYLNNAVDDKLNSLNSLTDVTKISEIINDCQYARLYLLDNLKLNPQDSTIQEITNKLVDIKQKNISTMYNKSARIDLVENPNWYYSQLPDKVLVREKESFVDNVVVDVIATENVKINNGRVEYVDREENTGFEIITHYWNLSNPLGQIVTGDGKVINALSELPNTDIIKPGDLIFSMVIKKPTKIVNKTYWKHIASTKVASEGSTATLNCTFTKGTSTDETVSIAKAVGTEFAIGSEFNGSAGIDELISIGTSLSFSQSVSKSLETTFERTFSVSAEESISIDQSFEANGKNRVVGLYQLIDEFELIGVDYFVKGLNNYFTNTPIKLVNSKPSILKSNFHTYVDVAEGDRDL